jgi:hypothetical protein
MMRPLAAVALAAVALASVAPRARAEVLQASSEPARVVIRGRTVFEVRAPDGATSAAQRARVAQATLERILDSPEVSNLATVEALPRTEGEPESLAIHVGGHEVFRVNESDASLSGMSAYLHAQSVATAVQGAISRERRRMAQHLLLQSVAMTVFLGLLAFLALRWIENAARRLRVLVEERLASGRGLSLRHIRIVSAQTLQGTSYALVGLGRVALQLGIIYAYASFALSQFEATRGWVGPLTRVVASPFVALIGRIGELVPPLLLLLAAAYVLRGALRLTGFLFDGVARGDVQWGWLPKDLAPAARPLVRLALVVAALLLFGPLVGAGSDALLGRLGLLAMAAVTLGSIPSVAAATVGTLAIFGRRYRIGEWLAIGGQVGELTHVGFLELTLVPLDAGRVRLSHLLTLWLPVRHLPGPPTREIEARAGLNAPPRAGPT